jgi:STE24 endopeptidase
MLVGTVLELAALPFQTALSRRWEREADRASLDLTGAPEVYRAAHIRLAETNLSDLDPPRWLYRLLFTHPTPPERLAAGAAWRPAS